MCTCMCLHTHTHFKDVTSATAYHVCSFHWHVNDLLDNQNVLRNLQNQIKHDGAHVVKLMFWGSVFHACNSQAYYAHLEGLLEHK